MTDVPGGAGDGDGDDPRNRPERHDPFAPLPLEDLPPVRRKNALDPPEPAGDPTGRSGASAMAAAETPLVPAAYDENELRSAVGATSIAEDRIKSRRRTPPTDDGADDGEPPMRTNRKMMLVAALTLVIGGGMAALVIVGKINSERYVIRCEADRVVVEQGRSFPPWGESPLGGAEWKPLKIPPEAPCQPYETENKSEIAARYLKVLQDQATAQLTAREVTKIDDAEAELKQGLLVLRSLGRDDERVDARNEIERLLGDVVYWRASAKLRSASDALTDAAKQFELAAASRPRHVTDASAWALHVRKLVEQLRAGPAGAAQTTFPPLPPAEHPSAPAGVALPVEPDAGSGSATSEPAPVRPANAGVPTGGVLL